MQDFTFTISATFTAETQQDAWDEWTDLLTQPRFVEDGTEIVSGGVVVDVTELPLPSDGSVRGPGWAAAHTCVLCGITFTGFGHNPEPLASYGDGRACDLCNDTKVIPARIAAWTERQRTYKIIRFYQDFDRDSKVMARGLTLDEAQAHCQREDTHGDGWFDGYEAES